MNWDKVLQDLRLATQLTMSTSDYSYVEEGESVREQNKRLVGRRLKQQLQKKKHSSPANTRACMQENGLFTRQLYLSTVILAGENNNNMWDGLLESLAAGDFISLALTSSFALKITISNPRVIPSFFLGK